MTCPKCGREAGAKAVVCECGAFFEGPASKEFWPVDIAAIEEKPAYKYSSLPRTRLGLALSLGLVLPLLAVLSWIAFSTEGAGLAPKVLLPAFDLLFAYYLSTQLKELRKPRRLLALAEGIAVDRKDGGIFIPYASIYEAKPLPYGFLLLRCNSGDLKVDLYQRKQIVLRAISATINEERAKAASRNAD